MSGKGMSQVSGLGNRVYVMLLTEIGRLKSDWALGVIKVLFRDICV